MFQLLEMTPWWVYLLFAYFLMLGVRASNPTIASFKKLAVLPIFFLGWALYGLLTDLESRYFFLIPWIMALLTGSWIGYLQVSKWPILVDAERQTISLPGSWSTLLLSISMFALKYIFGLIYATHPMAYKNSAIFGTDLIFSNLIVGMFWGRFWHFGHCLYQKE
ncbi:MAG TPA: hypothetical protein VHL30_02575 [Chlamydiales bacterium]|jgi:hypothetical protein|nr:hypothetical protein [Chlamydiales bacterium]